MSISNCAPIATRTITITPSISPSSTASDIIEDVVAIISSYLYTEGPDDQFSTSGRKDLKARVTRYVERNDVIELVLPAFPDKSPSRAKVLGTLPDMGEEIVLRRLEDLCKSIEDFYERGARLHIISDGIVYSQILGILDSAVYSYNSALRVLIKELNLTHIFFTRVADMLELERSGSSKDPMCVLQSEMTEEEYIDSAPVDRKTFLDRDTGEFDVEKKMRDDVGVLRTYIGYKMFLGLDLAESDLLKDSDGKRLPKRQRNRVLSSVAKQMLVHGAKFSHLVESVFPHAVRLSIHPHNNVGPKLALRVFPWKGRIRTPWHNTLCEKKDGSTVVGHVSLFSDENHEIVYRHGRPYLVREKDEDLKWDENVFNGISFERIHPFGLKVVAPRGKEIGFETVPMNKVRRLSSKHSFLLFSGFRWLNQEELVNNSKKLDTYVLSCGPVDAGGPNVRPCFCGKVVEIEEDPDDRVNGTTAREDVSMSDDGAFGTTESSGFIQIVPPRFQLFQCAEPSKDGDYGATIFIKASNMLGSFSDEERAFLRSKRFDIHIPNASNHIIQFERPLITANEEAGDEVLRWGGESHQEPNSQKLISTSASGMPGDQSIALLRRVTNLLYDRRWSLTHSWEEGDIAIADSAEVWDISRTILAPIYLFYLLGYAHKNPIQVVPPRVVFLHQFPL